jgi:hypothetical protein
MGKKQSDFLFAFSIPFSNNKIAAKRYFDILCPREELNLNHLLRREESYPLNDEGGKNQVCKLIK